MTKMNALTPSRVLVSFAALGLTSFAWSQTAAPTTTPAAAIPGAPAAAAARPAATPTVGTSAPAANNAERILPAPDRSTPVGATIAGGLASSSTVSAIQRQEYDNRDELLTEVTARVQQADRQIAELKQKTTGLDADAKQSLDTAVADYEKAKAKLQQSLQASRNADANTWERTRVTLATDYAFYVAAAAAVEVAAPNT